MSDDEERPRESVSADETVVPAAPAIDDPGAETWDPFDEMQEEFGDAAPGQYATASDGMPSEVDRATGSDIPPLSPTTLVCMADKSAFVVRDAWGYEGARFEPDEVERTPAGTYRVTREQYEARVRDPNASRGRWARWLYGRYVEVEPVRPACRHYGRQHSSFPENPSANYFSRLCTVRRSTEGAFMGVGNVAMYACSLREPRDLTAEDAMDSFDKKKMAQGRRRRHLPMKGGIFG